MFSDIQSSRLFFIKCYIFQVPLFQVPFITFHIFFIFNGIIGFEKTIYNYMHMHINTKKVYKCFFFYFKNIQKFSCEKISDGYVSHFNNKSVIADFIIRVSLVLIGTIVNFYRFSKTLVNWKIDEIDHALSNRKYFICVPISALIFLLHATIISHLNFHINAVTTTLLNKRWFVSKIL